MTAPETHEIDRRLTAFASALALFFIAACSESQPTPPVLGQASAANEASNTIAVSDIRSDDSYQWRIRALSEGGAGAWAVSEWFSGDQSLIASTSSDTSLSKLIIKNELPNQTDNELSAGATSIFSDDINVAQSSITVDGSLMSPGKGQSVYWAQAPGALGYEIGLRSRLSGNWQLNDVIDTEAVCVDNNCSLTTQRADEILGQKPEAILDQTVISGSAPLAISIDATASFDPDGDPIQLKWLLEGKYIKFDQNPLFTYTFENPGIYTVSLVISDDSGLTAREYVSVLVSENLAPTTASASPENVQTQYITNETGVGISNSSALIQIQEQSLEASPATTIEPNGSVGETNSVETNNSIAETNSVETNNSIAETNSVETNNSIAETNSVETTSETLGETQQNPFSIVTNVVATDNEIESNLAVEPLPLVSGTSPQDNITPVQTTAVIEQETISLNLSNQVAVDITDTIDNTDSTPPTIASISTEAITANSAKVRWKMDEYATGQVSYGPTETLGFSTFSEGSFAYSEHLQKLDGLAPDTTYFFTVTSMDESGNIVVSTMKQFRTLALTLAAAVSGEVNPAPSDTNLSESAPANYQLWSSSVLSYDEDLAMSGLFFGNPQAGGFGAANTLIGTDQAVRFRAQKTGFISGVKIPLRYLRDTDIYGRCDLVDRQASYQFYCDCIDAGLVGSPAKNTKCAYLAPGSGYLVGNGGTYDVEIREVASNGWPDFAKPALGTSLSSHVPMDHAHGSWDKIEISETPVVVGNEYFIVFKNKTPPPNNKMWAATVAEALAMPDNVGAMSINGLLYDDSPDSSKEHGPYFGSETHSTYYSRDNRRTWSRNKTLVGWWLVGYTDDTWVGQTHAASDGRFYRINDDPADVRVIGGNVVAKQTMKPKTNYQLDGVWINYGHFGSDSNGSSMTLKLRNSSGDILASAILPHNPELYALNNSGVSPFNIEKFNAKTWHYADLENIVTLSTGDDYEVELSASQGAGFVITGYETSNGLNGYSPEQVLISDIGGFAEVSLNNGSSWEAYGRAGSAFRDKSQLPILFTTVGGPKSFD